MTSALGAPTAPPRSRRRASILVAVALLAAACGQSYVFNNAPLQLQKGAWTHLRVEVTSGTPSHGKVSVDNVVLDAQ